MKKNVHGVNTVRIITVLVSILVIVALVTMSRNYLLNPSYGLLLGIIAIYHYFSCICTQCSYEYSVRTR